MTDGPVRIVRVSTALKLLLDNPQLITRKTPHCIWCRSPKTHSNRKGRCEMCGKFGTCTGRPALNGQHVYTEG